MLQECVRNEAGYDLDGISWITVEQFADEVAILPVNGETSGWLADHRRVGALAEQFAVAFFHDNLMRDTRPDIQRTIAVGWLFYAIEDHGLAFDDLCKHVGRQLAADISVVSADRRLPWLQRSMHVASNVGQAAKSLQLAVFAEIIARCERLHENLDADPHNIDQRHWIEMWLQTKGTVLYALESFKRAEPFKQAELSLHSVKNRLPQCD